MKKFLCVLLIIALFCGCAAEPVQEREESISSEKSTSELYESDLIWLKLPHHLPEYFDSAAGIEPQGKRVDIPFAPPESFFEQDSLHMEIGIPPEIEAEIKEDYPDFGGEGWSATLNYYSEDLSAGMIKIIYIIGDKIITNKAVICTVENGTVVRINYTNMDMDADEADLIERVEIFEKSTTQEKKIFEEGEEFLSEDVQYNYYYNLDTLVYCYQLFFYENTEIGPVINNDYASEYIIYEDGGIFGEGLV